VPEEEHLKNILPCQRIKQSTAELKEPTIEQQQEKRKEYNYNYKCGVRGRLQPTSHTAQKPQLPTPTPRPSSSP